MNKETRCIAVDFDGCLCENKWPEIGKENSIAINVLKKMRIGGAKLILWTCRDGEQLREAVEWCAARGLEFDAVNENLPENKEFFGGDTRKVCATEYWDDRSVIVNAKMMIDCPNGYVTTTWSDGGRSMAEMAEAARHELDSGARKIVGYQYRKPDPERVPIWKRIFRRKRKAAMRNG